MPVQNLLRRTSLVAALATLLSAAAVATPQNGNKPIYHVVLIANGEGRVLQTQATTIGELLAEQRITLTKSDRVSAAPEAKLVEGMEITVSIEATQKTSTITPNRSNRVATPKLGSRGASLSGISQGRRVLTMSATGYGPGENGPWGNQTATGGRVRRGIVAVDPRVIKLGTRLYVEGYGECVAADTGGAIKGMRIDLAFDSDRVANQYGRRSVKVVVLD